MDSNLDWRTDADDGAVSMLGEVGSLEGKQARGMEWKELKALFGSPEVEDASGLLRKK